MRSLRVSRVESLRFGALVRVLPMEGGGAEEGAVDVVSLLMPRAAAVSFSSMDAARLVSGAEDAVLFAPAVFAAAPSPPPVAAEALFEVDVIRISPCTKLNRS